MNLLDHQNNISLLFGYKTFFLTGHFIHVTTQTLLIAWKTKEKVENMSTKKSLDCDQELNNYENSKFVSFISALVNRINSLKRTFLIYAVDNILWPKK